MIGVETIAQMLPHRYPMLLVDRVIELVPGDRLTAVKAVTASEPWFRDWAQGDPSAGEASTPAVFPSGLLMESMCQAAALLGTWNAPIPTVDAGQVPLVGSLSNVAFLGWVEPGSVIEHQVRLVRDLGDNIVFSGTSMVDDRPVLQVGQMIMAVRPAVGYPRPGWASTLGSHDHA